MSRPSAPRRSLVATIVGLSVLLAACVGGRPAASTDMGADVLRADPDRPLSVYFSGDTEGFLSPCGCEMGQYGGLARRGAYLRAVKRPGDLAVDLGNLVTGDTPAHRVILDSGLEGLASLGYDAFVPGEGEIRVGPTFDQALAKRPGVRVVCANLVRVESGKPAFEPWFVATTAGGRRVAVVGVAEEIVGPSGALFSGVSGGYRVTPADEAVRAAFTTLAGKADAVVLATSMSAESARKLAAAFPQAALVVAGRATEGSKSLVSTSGAPLLLVGEFGWYVTRADFDASLRASDAKQAWLDERVPDDPETAGLVARFKAQMSGDGEFAGRLVESFRKQSYVGSESCAACHAAEFATWKASPHARAMRTLVEKKSQRDMQCVECHLVDVPPPAAAGASSAETDALGVGCEACHGGAARHVELARKNSSDAAKALAPATSQACLRCHFPPNDTHFAFDAKWPKIAHGKKAAPR